MIDGISSKAVREKLARNTASNPKTENSLTQVKPSTQSPKQYFGPDSDASTHQLFALSSVQTPILYRERYSPHTSINSQIVQVRLHGQVTWDFLETAIQQTVDSHDALRLRLVEEDGHMLQYFSPPRQSIAMNYVTLSDQEYPNNHYDWASQAISIPFNLIDSPLCKFYLIRFSNGDKGFALHCHQLICDRRSLWLTVKEIRRRCLNSSWQRQETVAPAVSIIDFLNKEQTYLHSPRFEWDRRYWIMRSKTVFSFSTLKKYTFHLDTLALDTLRFILEEPLTTNIKAFCAAQHITLYQFFLAVTALLLGRRTGNDDVALGQCVTRRFKKSQNEMIGACEVVLPLALRLDRRGHFLDLVHHTTSARRDLQRHAHFPPSSIMQIIEATHSGFHLLFDLLLQYCPGMSLEKDLMLHRGLFSEYPLTLCLQESDKQNFLILEWDFQICAWTSDEVALLHQELLTLVQDSLANPLRPLSPGNPAC